MRRIGPHRKNTTQNISSGNGGFGDPETECQPKKMRVIFDFFFVC